MSVAGALLPLYFEFKLRHHPGPASAWRGAGRRRFGRSYRGHFRNSPPSKCGKRIRKMKHEFFLRSTRTQGWRKDRIGVLDYFMRSAGGAAEWRCFAAWIATHSSLVPATENLT